MPTWQWVNSPGRDALLGVGQSGKKARPCKGQGFAELRGCGEQLWQEALGVGGLAQRDEQDEASHREHSCLWWGTEPSLGWECQENQRIPRGE